MRDLISAGSGHYGLPMRWRVWLICCPASALEAANGPVQGVVARIDWARFLPLYQQAGRRSFLAELEREVPESVPALSGESGKTQLVEQLTHAPVQRRKKLVADYLREAVAEVTRIDAAEIREDAGFFDLGMDSLMAVELRRRLEQALGQELPATLAMDYPRLSDVGDYLLGEVLGLQRTGSQSYWARTYLASDDTHGRADRDCLGGVPLSRRT